MLKTFFTSFLLKITYRVNSILYAIKQIPLIKKILPDSLYSIDAFKIFGAIIAYFYEVFSAVFGKVFYFLFLAGCTFGICSAGNLSFSQVFIYLFMFLTFVGGVSNLYMFSTEKSKYYAIILLNVDAKKYNLSNYLYQIFKLTVCYFVAFLILGLILDIPFWLCLMAPLFTVGVKSTAVGYSLKMYKNKGKNLGDNLFGKLTFPFVLLCTALGVVPPVFSFVLPYYAIGAIMGVFILTGIWGFNVMFKFDEYRQLSREQLLNPESLMNQQTNTQQIVKESTEKAISTDDKITSNKMGFEFLNDLFIKRHKKILWKPVKIISAVCLVIFVTFIILTIKIADMRETINSMLLNSLPYFMFIMYAINRGKDYTQALFINCDHSLLTYSAYKKPGNILKLFTIRLRGIIKMNLIPAAIIGLGLSSLLYTTGGTDNVINYVLLLVSPIAMSVFFSVHNLTIYYLLQPYNAQTEMKSAMYSVIMGATYMACYFFMQFELPTLYFGIAVVAFCIIYCIVSGILVYKLAPKTFRIRV
ncbi:MAG: hypothetical protein E7563_03285 [Ruminococcaceae bacterium]|nr:hypothetical protein [Oscillospiraceae bacterium]